MEKDPKIEELWQRLVQKVKERQDLDEPICLDDLETPFKKYVEEENNSSQMKMLVWRTESQYYRLRGPTTK